MFYFLYVKDNACSWWPHVRYWTTAPAAAVNGWQEKEEDCFKWWGEYRGGHCVHKTALACLVQAGEQRHKHRFQPQAAISINEQRREDLTWWHHLCLGYSKGSKELISYSNVLISTSDTCFGGCLSLWLWFLPFSFGVWAMNGFGFSHSEISHLTEFVQ